MARRLFGCVFLVAASASAAGVAARPSLRSRHLRRWLPPSWSTPSSMSALSAPTIPKQLAALGDALGTDCLVTSVLVDDQGAGWSTPYMNAGTANADWFGWNRPVLAPVEGTILEVHINDTVNQPA